VVTAALLINAGLEYLKDRGMDAAICHMFEHSPFYRLFIRQGFFRRRKSFRPFVVQPDISNCSSGALLNRKEWYMVEGDIDIF
jgi:hypothetical protein